MKIIRANSNKLTELRIKKGYTSLMLSRMAEVSYFAVKNAEKGNTILGIRPINAVKIAKALGVAFDELFQIIDRKEVEKVGEAFIN